MLHLPFLDGLRGVAVLLVVWAHLPAATGGLIDTISHRCAGFVLAGHLGVDLFFALSGFLITRILLEQRATGVPATTLAAVFYRRRLLRIFPIYYLLIAVCAVALPGYEYLPPAAYVANYFLAQDLEPHPLRHTWSLAVEEQFYLLWPWLVLTLSRERLLAWTARWIPLGSVLASVLILVLLEADLGCALVERGLESRILTLSLGASLAFRLPEHPRFLPRFSPRSLRGTVMAIAALVAITHATRLTGIAQLMTLVKHLGTAGISFLCLRWLLDQQDTGSWPHRFLGGSLVGWIGRISYGLYLYHFVVFFVLVHVWSVPDEPPGVLPVLGAVAVAFLLAIASYHLIERPLLRRKDRIRPGGITVA